MPKGKSNSRVLRQLAEDFLQSIPGDREMLENEGEDLATSLVRQWITYDGNATLFLGDRQFYFVLGRTPLGNFRITPVAAGPGWTKQLMGDWKVSPDNLAEAFDQLNRGQSAEVINGDGVPLRIWVDPKKRSRGVESLVKVKAQPAAKRDYLKIATDLVESQLGNSVNSGELAALARSLAKQWQQHEGFGCILLDDRRQLVFELTEHADGTCNVAVRRKSLDLASFLSSSGFPSDALGELIAKINLGQEFDFRDRQGVRRRLSYDPKAMRIHIHAIDLAPSSATSRTPPIFCPKCSAVLKPWRDGEREQACSHCGHIMLPE